VKKLYRIAEENKTKLDLSKSRGHISVAGRSKYVSKAVVEITHQLREYEKDKLNIQHAKTMVKYVQWYYDDSGKWKKYNAEVNYDIETAYKDKRMTVKIKDGRGEFYIIDFHQMEECEYKNRNNKVKVSRQEKGTGKLILSSILHLNGLITNKI